VNSVSQIAKKTTTTTKENYQKSKLVSPKKLRKAAKRP